MPAICTPLAPATPRRPPRPETRLSPNRKVDKRLYLRVWERFYPTCRRRSVRLRTDDRRSISKAGESFRARGSRRESFADSAFCFKLPAGRISSFLHIQTEEE